jgi:hypothetical protein
MVFILKIIFVVTNDINHIVILGTIFSDMITPYKTGHENITSKINGLKLVFPSLEKPKTRNLNIIKAYCIYIHQINALISEKKTQFMHLKQDVFFFKKNRTTITKSCITKRNFRFPKQNRIRDLF